MQMIGCGLMVTFNAVRTSFRDVSYNFDTCLTEIYGAKFPPSRKIP